MWQKDNYHYLFAMKTSHEKFLIPNSVYIEVVEQISDEDYRKNIRLDFSPFQNVGPDSSLGDEGSEAEPSRDTKK